MMSEGTELQQEDPGTKEARPMGLLKALGMFAMAYVAFAVLLALKGRVEGFPVWGLVVGYLAIGVALNRLVLRPLIEWHPMHNTLRNVANAKLGMILFWPLRYPILFFQLLVDRHL